MTGSAAHDPERDQDVSVHNGRRVSLPDWASWLPIVRISGVRG
jgi:hypothetical protein